MNINDQSIAEGIETDLIIWSFLGYGNIQQSGLTNIWYGDHHEHGELVPLANYSEDDAAAITLIESMPIETLAHIHRASSESVSRWHVWIYVHSRSSRHPHAGGSIGGHFNISVTDDSLALAICRAWIAYKRWEAEPANAR